jgi:hypothetical protein
MVVTPHVAQKARSSAIDGRTTQHPGYALSQRRRKKIEEPFGWAKTVGGMAQTVHRGLDRVRAQFTNRGGRITSFKADFFSSLLSLSYQIKEHSLITVICYRLRPSISEVAGMLIPPALRHSYKSSFLVSPRLVASAAKASLMGSGTFVKENWTRGASFIADDFALLTLGKGAAIAFNFFELLSASRSSSRFTLTLAMTRSCRN